MGFKQVIQGMTSMLQPLKLRLSSSLFSCHETHESDSFLGTAASDIASGFLNTPEDPSKSLIFVQAPRELPYSEPTVWHLKRQLYGLRDAPKSWQAHFSQIMVSKEMVQMKSDSRTFLKKDQLVHVQPAVMAYVDDLVVSGNAQMVKEFITMIQEELTLTHVNFLTSENPVEFLGRTIKRLKNGKITMELSQKFIDELLKIFEITGKVTTTWLKLQALPEDRKAQSDEVTHQKFRSAVGKLLWMAQPRDDLKYPVKELSRLLTNPQDQDVKNLIDLLKYVNQTRDFVFIMEPQLPVRHQEGRFRLWAAQTQIRQVFKSHGHQQLEHWCSTSVFSQQAELRLQLLILQQKVNPTRWLKQHQSRLQSRISFRSSAQPFFHPQSVLSFRQIHQRENQWLQSTPSSSIFGFKIRPKKVNWSSTRSELTSTRQMSSRNTFQHQF